MKNAALKIDPPRVTALRPAAPRLLEGTVARREGTGFVVRAEGTELHARRAVSCLVEPEVADRVLAGDVGGEVFVLAVLERQEGAPATLAHDGDLRIRLDRGRCEIEAQRGVGITSPADVSVVAATANLRAVDAGVAVSRLSLVGRLVQAEVEKVKLFGESLDTVVERTSQRVKRAYRIVEEMEQLRAGAVDYAARAVMRLHGKNTVVTSEEVVKVDANQIHMG